MSQPPWPLTSTDSNRDPRDTVPNRRSAFERRPETEQADEAAPIICFCHLGWDWVWQRPQQYLSRFAKRHRVLFVELYCSEVRESQVTLKQPAGHPNVTVLQQHLPAARWRDGGFVDAERRRLLKHALENDLAGQFDQPLLWFYDPMAVVAYAGADLGERAIVYDCMDELSQFRGAPPALVTRERELLKRADVVFCGGQKMRQKRLPVNPNTHFFGTGVDIEHFGRALSRDLAVAPEIGALRGAPVLGYFGVIDERIDYDLLAALADARRDWHIVMVGPTAKVNPAEFPERQNLHWIGPRPYAELPAFAKGFSVALMPFALNAATEFINPTKALEYMAAGRPVVSTALDEVKMNFGKVARIAESAREFIELCRREVAKPSRSRVERGIKLAAENTWEANVAKMERHIADALARQDNRAECRERLALPSASLTNLAYV